MSSSYRADKTTVTSGELVGLLLAVVPGVIMLVLWPRLALTITLLVIGLLSRSVLGAAIASSAAVLHLLATMNAGKAVTGDWQWYSTVYFALETAGPDSVLGFRFGSKGWVPAESEPVFYFIAHWVSSWSGADLSVFAVVVTLVIYMPLVTAATILLRRVHAKSSVVVTALVTSTLGGITFTITTQLVRQEIALALLVLGATLAFISHRTAGGILIVLAVLTHNSAVVPLAILLLIYFFQERPKFLFSIGVISSAAAGVAYLTVFSPSSYATQDDGSISLLTIILDILVVVAFWLLAPRVLSQKAVTLTLCGLACYLAFLSVIYVQPLPFLRMYFYLEGFRFMAIIVTVAAAMKTWPRFQIPIAASAAGVGLLLIETRLRQSPFSYATGDSLIALLFM